MYEGNWRAESAERCLALVRRYAPVYMKIGGPIEAGPPVFSEGDKAKIVALTRQGKVSEQVARECGCSISYVTHILRLNNVPTPTDDDIVRGLSGDEIATVIALRKKRQGGRMRTARSIATESNLPWKAVRAVLRKCMPNFASQSKQ